MLRPWHVWSAFLACLAVVAIALGLLTLGAIRLDSAESVARQQVAIEENARLALWRMDSAMATLVATESARPYFAYQPFYGDQVPTKSKVSTPVSANPSPLLTEETPLVRLHFQLDASGNVTSPRAPTGPSKRLAVPQYLSAKDWQLTELRCAEIGKQINPPELIASLPEVNPSETWQMSGEFANSPPAQPEPIQQNAQPLPQAAQPNQQAGLQQQAEEYLQPEQQIAQQKVRSSNEYRARSQYFNQNRALPNIMNGLALSMSPVDSGAAVMTPLWVGNELLLARKVMIDSQPVVQACWLDLDAIRTQLLASTSDLLPAAKLQPAKAPVVEQAHLLASLPLELIPGAIASVNPAGFTPMQFSLVTAWGAFALATVAVAMLLFGVISLSERRASFVSAVTHELRTPLTTFRLYSEMLAEGMVPDELSRGKYLNTLRTEADRLMHLVENVLAYAKLERGRLDKRIVPIRLAELIERSESRLRARCDQVGLELKVEGTDAALNTQVLADPSAVEQVLFNLVDNACKYAVRAEDRTLRLEAVVGDRQARICLQDHGPGIESAERGKLFRPFHKSAHEAAVTAPGVGLGLALSRRLARAMGGDLTLEDCPSGTRFSLRLNLANPSDSLKSR